AEHDRAFTRGGQAVRFAVCKPQRGVEPDDRCASVSREMAVSDADFGTMDLEAAVEGDAGDSVHRALDDVGAHKPDHPIQTNVEYYAAVVLELCGMPREMFSPSF